MALSQEAVKQIVDLVDAEEINIKDVNGRTVITITSVPKNLSVSVK